MAVERQAERGVEPGGRRRTAIARETLVWVRVRVGSSLQGGWTAPGNRRDDSARVNPPDPIRPKVGHIKIAAAIKGHPRRPLEIRFGRRATISAFGKNASSDNDREAPILLQPEHPLAGVIRDINTPVSSHRNPFR